jgi:hypothetical protein
MDERLEKKVGSINTMNGSYHGPGSRLECLDADVFDIIFRKLSPDETVKLGATSRTLKALAAATSLWREWCERRCPSLRTEPAKSFLDALSALDDEGQGQGCKRLYQSLIKEKRLEHLPWWKDKLGIYNDSFDWAGHLLLLDVHLEASCLLSCSVDGAELLPVGPSLVHVFSSPTLVVNAESEQLLRSTFHEHASKQERYEPYNVCIWDSKLYYSWRVLRRSDLRISVLLNGTGSNSGLKAYERSSVPKQLPHRQSFDIKVHRGLGHRHFGNIYGPSLSVYMIVCCGTEDEDCHFSRFKVIKEGTFKVFIWSRKRSRA